MLSRLSVKKPMTVFVCVVLVLILGVMSFINMMDVYFTIASATTTTSINILEVT